MDSKPLLSLESFRTEWIKECGQRVSRRNDKN